MKLGLVFSVLVVGLVACGTSAPAKDASAPHRSCTSNSHCASDEVCFYYDTAVAPLGGVSNGAYPQPWRDGYCGKLSK